MAWRLMMCLLLHIILLFSLAIYLATSLNSLHLDTPLAKANEREMESLNTLPELLAAMDAQRHAFQKSGEPRDRDLYDQMRGMVESNLAALDTPLVLPGPDEKRRRELIRSWIGQIGDPAVTAQPPVKAARPADTTATDAASSALLEQINAVTAKVRTEVSSALTGLQEQDANEASARINTMWFMVLTVTGFTILIQLALANSIIGPIKSLAGVVRRLQSGDYTARAKINSGDELQSLGDTFNAMAQRILVSQRELQEKNKRLSQQQDTLRYINAGLEERVDLKTRELEDKNQKLNEAVRLKDAFLATLSHEIRNPLTPILTSTHLLVTDSKLDPEQLKIAQAIDRNAHVLSRMIDDLLDLSSVSNRKLRLARERTEMNEWARATVESVRPAWEKKQLTLNFIPNDEPFELEIDPARLGQVLTNLVTNAIKYTDPQGRITVRVTLREEGMRIAVTDTGAGLTREEIGKIFEMFHQSRTPQTQKVGGLGVGLAIARSLAELHGGGLFAESLGPGRGTTFTLWLPQLKDSQAVDFSAPSLTPLPEATDRRLLRGRRILLVEDSTDTREALERIFRRRECDVMAAASGEEVLALLQHAPPDIIISDLGLPGISGLELMACIRKTVEWQDVVAVALSGLGQEKDIQAALDAGFDAHLLKPVDMTVLDQTLSEALQKRSEQKHLNLIRTAS